MECSPVTPRYVLFFPVYLGKGAIILGKTKRVVWLHKDKLVVESAAGWRSGEIVSQVAWPDSWKLATFFEEGLVNEMYCRAMTQWYEGRQACYFCVKIPDQAHLENFCEQIKEKGYKFVKHSYYPWGTLKHEN